MRLAQRRAWRRNPLEGLAENARTDPLPEVRLRNLSALRLNAGYRLKALRQALGDQHESVRAHAALWLGKEGRPTLLDPRSAAWTFFRMRRGWGVGLWRLQRSKR